MTIDKLKKRIAGYHEKALADFVRLSDEDLLLTALNNARLSAEQVHDLESSYVMADLVVDEVAGVSLDNAYLHGDTETAVKIKTIETMGRFTDDGLFYPVEWQRMRAKRDSQLRKQELSTWGDVDDRVPSDAEWSARHCLRQGLYVYGNQVYLRLGGGTAGTTHIVGIEGSMWLPDYTDDTEEDADAFIAHGSNYLMWQGICEVNYLFRKFAPREEGNVTAPTREAATALDAFLRWDTYSQLEGRRRL